MPSINDFQMNGITVNTSAPPPSVGPLSSAIVCFVGIAPNKIDDIQLNEPVKIDSLSHAVRVLDPLNTGSSTLLPALKFLFQKANATAYVIVVEKGADAAATESNIRGGIDSVTGQRTGIMAISTAKQRPTIITAPGFNTKETGQLLASEAREIKAIAVVDGPNTNTIQALTYSAGYGPDESNLIIADPWAVVDGQTIPASILAASCLAAVDTWESPQNQSVAISELSRPIGYSITGEQSEHNVLNKNGIVTFAATRMGGHSLIGNRTCTGAFISHKGLENALARKLEEISQPYMGKNLTKHFIDSVVDRLNNWITSLVAQGVMPEARVYLHPDLNNLDNYNSGRWYIALDYGRYSPNEHMVYGLNVNNDIIEQFVEGLS